MLLRKPAQDKPNNIGDLLALMESVRHGLAVGQISFIGLEVRLQSLFDHYCNTHRFTEEEALELICTFVGRQYFSRRGAKEKLQHILTNKYSPYRQLLERAIHYPADVYFLDIIAMKFFGIPCIIEKPQIDATPAAKQLGAQLGYERDQAAKAKVFTELNNLHEGEQALLQIQLEAVRKQAAVDQEAAQLRKHEQALNLRQIADQIDFFDQQQKGRLEDKQAELAEREAMLKFNYALMRRAQEQEPSPAVTRHPDMAQRFASTLQHMQQQMLFLQQEQKTTQLLARTTREAPTFREKLQKWCDRRLAENFSYTPLCDSLTAHTAISGSHSVSIKQICQRFFSSNNKALLLFSDQGIERYYAEFLEQEVWRSFSAKKIIPILVNVALCQRVGPGIIEEALQKQGFTLEEISTLQRQHEVLIILSGVDALPVLQSLYLANQLDHWRGRVVYTASTDLVRQERYQELLIPVMGEEPHPELYEEWIINPLTENAALAYVKQLDLRAFQYFAGQPALKPLLFNFFSLQSALKIYNAKILSLDAFLSAMSESWFNRYKIKLLRHIELNEVINLMGECAECIKRLARLMCQQGIYEITIPNEQTLINNQKFFQVAGMDPALLNLFKKNKFIRMGYPLRQIGENRYAFLCPHLQLYFAERLLTHVLSSPVVSDPETEALFQQGVLFDEGSDFERAFQCYSQAATRGDFRAQTNAAVYHLEAKGGAPYDLHIAKEMLLCAARQGASPAMYMLAQLCENYSEIGGDTTKEAEYWYQEAAKLGEPNAAQRLESLAFTAARAATV